MLPKEFFKKNFEKIIFLIVLVFYLYNLSHHSTFGDEFGTMWLAKQDIDTLLSVDDVHPPTHYLMLWFWGRIFGTSDFALRSLAILPAILTFMFIFQKTKEFFPNLNQYIFSAILITSPTIYMNSRVARYYTFVMFFGVLSFYYFYRWIKTEEKKEYAFWLITSAALFYFHYLTAASLIFGYFFYYLFIYKKKIDFNLRFKKLVYSGSYIFMIIMPLLIYNLIKLLKLTFTSSNINSQSLSFIKLIVNTFASSLFPIYSSIWGESVFPWNPYVALPALSILTTAIILIFHKYRLIKKDNILFIIFVLGFPILFGSFIISKYFAVIGFSGIAARFLYIIPILIFLIFFIFNKYLNKNLLFILSGLWIFLNVYSLTYYHTQESGLNIPAPIKKVSGWIETETPPNRVVIDPFWHGWEPILSHYIKDSKTIFVSKKKEREFSASDKSILDSLTSQNLSVAVVKSTRLPGLQEQMEDFILEKGYCIKKKKYFHKQDKLSMSVKTFLLKHIFRAKYDKSNPFMLQVDILVPAN